MITDDAPRLLPADQVARRRHTFTWSAGDVEMDEFDEPDLYDPAAARARVLEFEALRAMVEDVDGEDEIVRALVEAFAEVRRGFPVYDDEAERARYDLRVDAGNVGGGRFRKLSDQMVALLSVWARGEGDNDPLDQFTRDQLAKTVTELRKKALAEGDQESAERLTPRRGASSAELKLALYEDVRAERKTQRQGSEKPSARFTLQGPGRRDQDVAVYRDSKGRPVLYRETDAGRRGSLVGRFDDLGELEQWATDNQEPRLAEWAAKERAVRTPAKAAKVPVEKAVPVKVAKKAPGGPARQRGQRRVAPWDPFAAYQDGGEAGLRGRLAELNLEQLRDMVAAGGMDRTGQAMKWRDRDRVTDLIVERVADRSVKGHAFRPPPATTPSPAAVKKSAPGTSGTGPAPVKKVARKAAPDPLADKKREADEEELDARNERLYVAPREPEMNTPIAASYELDRAHSQVQADEALEGLTPDELREVAVGKGLNVTGRTESALRAGIVAELAKVRSDWGPPEAPDPGRIDRAFEALEGVSEESWAFWNPSTFEHFSLKELQEASRRLGVPYEGLGKERLKDRIFTAWRAGSRPAPVKTVRKAAPKAAAELSPADQVFAADAFKRFTLGRESVKDIAGSSGGMWSEARVRKMLRDRGVDLRTRAVTAPVSPVPNPSDVLDDQSRLINDAAARLGLPVLAGNPGGRPAGVSPNPEGLDTPGARADAEALSAEELQTMAALSSKSRFTDNGWVRPDNPSPRTQRLLDGLAAKGWLERDGDFVRIPSATVGQRMGGGQPGGALEGDILPAPAAPETRAPIRTINRGAIIHGYRDPSSPGTFRNVPGDVPGVQQESVDESRVARISVVRVEPVDENGQPTPYPGLQTHRRIIGRDLDTGRRMESVVVPSGSYWRWEANPSDDTSADLEGEVVDTPPRQIPSPARPGVSSESSPNPPRPSPVLSREERVAAAKVAIEDAYFQLDTGGRETRYVQLAELRPLLPPDMAREDVDRALTELGRLNGVDVVPDHNRAVLTPEEHAAAVVIGNTPKHAIKFHRRVTPVREVDAGSSPGTTERGSYPDPSVVVSPEREAAIRAAAEQVPGRDGWVTLLDLRRQLGDQYDRVEVDNVLQKLNRSGDWLVTPELNQKALTPDEHRAAVVIGNQPKHAVRIIKRGPQAPSSNPPPVVDTPPVKATRQRPGPAATRAAVPVTVHLRTGASSESSTWSAERIDGLPGSDADVLAAVTSYVRQPGFVNTRLRTPEPNPDPSAWKTWLHEGSIDEMLGRVPFDEAAERSARQRADQLVAALDRVVEQSRTTAPATTYRGAAIDDIGLPEPGSAAGYTWTDPGFVSTSTNRDVAAGSFGSGPGRVTMEVRSPAGTPAMRIDGLGEDEVVLGRGLTFRVVEDHRGPGGDGRVVVEVVPPAAKVASPAAVKMARGRAAKAAGPLPRSQYDALTVLADQDGGVGSNLFSRTVGSTLEQQGLARRDGDRLFITDAGRQAIADRAPRVSPAPEVAAQVRAVGGDRELIREILDKVAATDLRQVAEELNITVPATARTAPARRQFIATSVADHYRRRTGGL